MFSYLSAFLLMALLLAGCSGEEDLAGVVAAVDGGQDDGQAVLTVQVSEDAWSDSPTTVTRAGETLNGLRATTGTLPTGYGYGFGLYVYAGETAMMENRQVTWNGTKARWNYGDDAYWPKTSAGETLKAFAYAPYKGVSPWVVTTAGVLSFSTASNGLSAVDLLYANDADINRSTGETNLEFKHALAKVSLGAVANASSTRDMLVSGISVTGSFYTGGNVDLTTGTWSDKTPVSPSSQTVTIIDEDAGQYIYVPAGGQTMVRTTTSVVDPILGRVNLVVENALSPMIIPGPTVSVTYNYYEQPDLVSPTDAWFHEWTGADGSATPTSGELTDYANNLGREVGGSTTVMGSAKVYYLDYADLSDYDKLIFQGTSGMGLRILMNRLVAPSPTTSDTRYSGSDDANGGKLMEAWANIGVDGYAVLDLTQYRVDDGAGNKYVHLNAIKVHYSSTTGTVNKLLLLKKTENRTEKTVTLDNVLTPEQGKDKVLNLRFGKNYEVVIGGASRLMNN